MGESTPVLADAVFHRIGHTTPPESIPLVLNAPWEQYDGMLIISDAILLDRQLQPGGIKMWLRTDDQLFEATLQSSALGSIMSVPVNSHVRISGICMVRSGGFWSVPQSFRVLLRSAQDLTVLQKPSWWSLRHTIWVLGIALGILLIVLAWILVLGRRLRDQMVTIRQRLQHWAVLEERNRIARELHDTLEQELAGITMQLDLAVDCFQQAPRVAQEALDTARRMSRHSMLEARRSVWDLRCHLLENGDLVSALLQTVTPLPTQDQVQVDVKVEGRPVRLAGAIEMNLLRIGQEAVTNAIKHGKAQNVTVELRYAAESVELWIRDDGCGFVPDNNLPGHFGLLDMRERAQSMGCSLLVDSQRELGTAVGVNVPIDATHMRDEELKVNSHSGR
jgi:signal transduction histidine kinase